ncbi:MAG: hypothetical protein A2156_11715 [Deltaproteobacteria bacterium RBG_16_48_10]|nr:MAG: hypothetical protein A2156_11715 [Deltaproteobacteria bacterium RBG_16_48_10]
MNIAVILPASKKPWLLEGRASYFFNLLLGSVQNPTYSYLDSYTIKSENLPLTFLPPHPGLPLRGEGKGEGKISNIFGYDFFLLGNFGNRGRQIDENHPCKM